MIMLPIITSYYLHLVMQITHMIVFISAIKLVIKKNATAPINIATGIDKVAKPVTVNANILVTIEPTIQRLLH